MVYYVSNFEIESLFTLGQCKASQNIWLKPACIVQTILFELYNEQYVWVFSFMCVPGPIEKPD